MTLPPKTLERPNSHQNTMKKQIPIPNEGWSLGEEFLPPIHIFSPVSISFHHGSSYAAEAVTVSTSTFGSGADLPPRSVARALGFLV